MAAAGVADNSPTHHVRAKVARRDGAVGRFGAAYFHSPSARGIATRGTSERSAPGTRVTLAILRVGWKDPRAFTLVRDSRDAAGERRWAVLLSDDALARCHGQGNCTEVCPMELAPTTSIIRLRALATRKLLGLS
jgi:ferredoxin